MRSSVEFLQELIRTPSLPGEEQAISELILREMIRLGFDECRRDQAGNVIGHLRGQGRAPSVMFNTHLDHVSAGEPSRWQHPPFGGETHHGRVWGRGAVDIKGPVAAQVYGLGGLARDGIVPAGDVYLSCVVQEEVGGLGARYLGRELKTDLVVVGEPSRNQLRIGHRGRIEAQVRIDGRSAHASLPDRGVNPLSVAARFLLQLEALEMRVDPVLGPASVVPTLIRTDQVSANVIPGQAVLTCDWRTVSGEEAPQVQASLQKVLERSLIAGASGAVVIPRFDRRTYTGYREDLAAAHPAFALAGDHPAVLAAQRVLETTFQEPFPAGIWRFATDGGHFHQAGMTVIGFGPGDDTLAHTFEESISIDDLLRGEKAYRQLALHWPEACR